MAEGPCKNPNCKSHGMPHPNCRCYSGMLSNGFASGGEVKHCSTGLPHMADCQYYAEGGEVAENQVLDSNPELATDHAIASHGLYHLMTKTGYSKSPDPTMPAQEFVKHSKTGARLLDSHSKQVFEKSKIDLDPTGTQALKEHLDTVAKNPQQLMNVGGNIGEYLPTNAASIAAKTASAVTYLQGIAPHNTQNLPLDKIVQPTKQRQAAYDRQLHVAQNPLSTLNGVKTGMLKPVDVITLKTIYPELYLQMRNKATEALIDAKTNGKTIRYKQKQGLATLIGQPLESSQTPSAMQAIIMSQAPKPIQNDTKKSKGSSQKEPSSATQKTIEKTDKLYETPLEQLQTNRKS